MRLDPNIPIAVATRNPDKLRELIALWGDEPPPLIPPPPEYPEVNEPFDTYEENALIKARTLADLRNGPALADDSGIEVEVMGWKPGVASARTPRPDSTWEERNQNILRAIAAAGASRRARFVCVCALVAPGFEPIVARGEVEGLIADRARGTHGFGYDPIFVYPPYGATFAEVCDEMKHAVSHRGRAVRTLREKLAKVIAK